MARITLGKPTEADFNKIQILGKFRFNDLKGKEKAYRLARDKASKWNKQFREEMERNESAFLSDLDEDMIYYEDNYDREIDEDDYYSQEFDDDVRFDSSGNITWTGREE